MPYAADMELVCVTRSFAQMWTQALKKAGSMAVDDLGTRQEMSVGRTVMPEEEAMENWS